jgi:hypothetical protein
MNILIAAPVRNRGWILNQYMSCLKNLNISDNISYYFILNDCTDDSKEILDYYIEKEIDEMNFNTPSDMGENGQGRSGLQRELYTYKNLSVLRNKILEYARNTNVDYIFSVDTDILVKPDILEKLLSTEKDIVAALINNGGKNWNFLHFQGDRGYVPEKLFEVRVTGACYLISRNVFMNESIKYSNEFGSGEDEAFCEYARRQGFHSYVLPDEQIHVMRRRGDN